MAADLHQQARDFARTAWGIKIGKSVDVQRRAEELRLLPILSIVKKGYPPWAHGEWFWPGDALLFYMNSLVVGGDGKIECGGRDTALRLLVQIYQGRHDVGYAVA